MVSTATKKKQKILQRRPAMAAALPFDVITEILLWLPVNSLLRFKSVSKAWRKLITDPDFAKLHHSRSIQSHSKLLLLLQQSKFFSVDLSKLDEVVEIYSVRGIMERHICDTCRKRQDDWRPDKFLIGSSNGLICVFKQGKFALFSPFTQTHRMIPCLNLPSDYFMLRGFGYDPISYDHKVLVMWHSRIFRDPWSRTQEAWVYSLNSNSWREVAYPESMSTTLYFHCRTPIFLHNAIYWLCRKVSHDKTHKSTITITCFDIHHETYDELPLPPTLGNGCVILKLVSFEDCLCVINHKPNILVDIWVMNGYGSWSKSYVMAPVEIRYALFEDVICRTGRHEILLFDKRKGLVQYDTRDTSIRKIILVLSSNK
ncbi:hypothetical protein Dimus_027554 [Dionaea muscipula]